MQRKVIVNVFPRARYAASASGRTHFPRERDRLRELFGQATQIWFHGRVYSRDTGVSVDFDITQGCMGDEAPADALTQIAVSKSSTSPNLPWDGTSMSTVPADGSFYAEPGMGLVDIQAKCAGGTGSIEFELWATVILYT